MTDAMDELKEMAARAQPIGAPEHHAFRLANVTLTSPISDPNQLIAQATTALRRTLVQGGNLQAGDANIFSVSPAAQAVFMAASLEARITEGRIRQLEQENQLLREKIVAIGETVGHLVGMIERLKDEQ